MENMNRLIICAIGVLLTVASCQSQTDKPDYNEVIEFAVSQTNNTLQEVQDTSRIPRTLDKNNKLTTVDIYNWTSGFFAGNLWYIYQLTGEGKWKNEAIRWTEALAPIQHWSGHHDVGFMIGCSYGNGYRLGDQKEYKEVLINAAESLSKRYNPKVGLIKSWDYRQAWDGKTEWFYPVIIDNMMNLEILFEASILSGNAKYYDIAVAHADATMKNHYRADYSCYHVVDYDEETGSVKDKATCQGFTDESSWARGQAWGLYGYALCYRYTKDAKYLNFALNIADFILSDDNLPDDLVPLWDYNVQSPGFIPEWDYNAAEYPVIPRDASAAAIVASALIEISRSAEQGDKYYDKAVAMVNSLVDNYKADPEENKYFILDHSVGSIPHGVEKDVPLVYADYYLLEALVRLQQK